MQQFTKFYFANGGLADNSPNFPTTKVSLHTVYYDDTFATIVIKWRKVITF